MAADICTSSPSVATGGCACSVRARNVFVKILGETRDRYGAVRDVACGTVGGETANYLGK
jgi:hypothetical protein